MKMDGISGRAGFRWRNKCFATKAGLSPPGTWAQIADWALRTWTDAQNWKDSLDHLVLVENPSLNVLNVIYSILSPSRLILISYFSWALLPPQWLGLFLGVINQVITEMRTQKVPLGREAGVRSSPAGGQGFILQLLNTAAETFTFTPRMNPSLYLSLPYFFNRASLSKGCFVLGKMHSGEKSARSSHSILDRSVFINDMLKSLVCIVCCAFILRVPGESKYCVSVHFEVEILGQ